jgi:hypothetical protein
MSLIDGCHALDLMGAKCLCSLELGVGGTCRYCITTKVIRAQSDMVARNEC